MKNIQIKSTSETISYIYSLSLSESTFRFRGQANYDWTLQPSIYRYNSFKRYQTVDFEQNILLLKPKVPQPPLTHTTFDLEWLMLCQHYGIPTRLMDWSMDFLIALFFACHGEYDKDGALFICNQNDYRLFSAFNKNVMEIQELVFVNTNVINPRMRAQSGCFMLWGHSPLNREVSTESYDLWQFHEQNGNKYFLEKLCIPKSYKQKILDELKLVYSISYENLYLKNGYLENQYGVAFDNLKEQLRLMTLYKTDADRLSKSEERIARSFFSIDCRNMFGSCDNLSQIG